MSSAKGNGQCWRMSCPPRVFGCSSLFRVKLRTLDTGRFRGKVRHASWHFESAQCFVSRPSCGCSVWMTNARSGQCVAMGSKGCRKSLCETEASVCDNQALCAASQQLCWSQLFCLCALYLSLKCKSSSCGAVTLQVLYKNEL